jgi:uncharacterized protein with NAD-binding domain and iron-sulfur cluster
MSNKYHIIGSGPTGLTLATILSYYGHDITVIDKEDTIGGIHRVKRVDNYFTEHGPRIYSSSFINFINILKNVDIDFYNYFVPYLFNMTNIGKKSINNFKVNEIMCLTYSFIIFMINPNSYKKITMKKYLNKHNFSNKAIDYINRLCILSDGADITRFTVYQFFQMMNQQTFYNIYQPNKTNDHIDSWLNVWKKKLENRNVKFILTCEVKKINIDFDNNYVESIKINNKGIVEIVNLQDSNLILAMPPKYISKLIYNKKLIDFELENKYNTYISITFHWNNKMSLPKVWGFPKTDWGILYIVLSDYMEDLQGLTISSCIAITDKTSKRTNLTADQTYEKEELIKETFLQLKESYPCLSIYDKAIVSPGVYYHNNKWHMTDSSTIITKHAYDENNKIGNMINAGIVNLFNCGTHNNEHKYSFTSVESACENAIYLAKILEPKSKFKIQSRLELRHVIFFIIIILVMYISS